MPRRTQPEFVAAENLDQQERARLALFLYTLRKQPNVIQAIIDDYTHQTDLIEAYEDPEVQATKEVLEEYRDNVPFDPAPEDYPYQSDETKALFAVGGLLRYDIDMRVDTDRATAEAMRTGIEQSRRQEGPRREPRLVRLGVLAMEEASYQMYANVINFDIDQQEPSGALSMVDQSFSLFPQPDVA